MYANKTGLLSAEHSKLGQVPQGRPKKNLSGARLLQSRYHSCQSTECITVLKGTVKLLHHLIN